MSHNKTHNAFPSPWHPWKGWPKLAPVLVYHPAQTSDRQSLVLLLSWTCHLKPAQTARGTEQHQHCAGAKPAGRISAPLTHGTGLDPTTNSNIFPTGMRIYTENTKNQWPEHGVIVKSGTSSQMDKANTPSALFLWTLQPGQAYRK